MGTGSTSVLRSRPRTPEAFSDQGFHPPERAAATHSNGLPCLGDEVESTRQAFVTQLRESNIHLDRLAAATAWGRNPTGGGLENILVPLGTEVWCGYVQNEWKMTVGIDATWIKSTTNCGECGQTIKKMPAVAKVKGNNYGNYKSVITKL